MTRFFFVIYFIFSWAVCQSVAQSETPQKSLNQYVGFINSGVGVVTDRFQMLRKYEEAVALYRKRPGNLLNLPSSGPLEEFYYRKSLEGSALPAAEKQRLNAKANALWELLNRLDETSKALETHVRLKAYQGDNLKQSDVYVAEIQKLLSRISSEQSDFYQQIQQVYRRHQPFVQTDPYLSIEKEMEQVLISQKELMESLPFYLHPDNRLDWPVEKIRKSMLDDEKMLSDFGRLATEIAYPASDAVKSFRSALAALQAVKQNALDDHNFAAQQSARHGNQVYLSLLNYYNNDLLANHKSFVNYSRSAKQLLDYPEFSPVISQEPAGGQPESAGTTQPFQEKPMVTFHVKPATAPASAPMLGTLNGYVDFVNESLRQMHLLQMLVRNYQSSAEYYRDPAKSGRRGNLTYAHDDFKIPESAYQMLMHAGNTLPATYRAPIENQAEVLMNILREMDQLSIELIRYTSEKKYLTDQLKRSDAILDRYAYLFEIFDRKKEQFYNDLRRIHGSYPNANPKSSWSVAGNALLKTMDDDREMLFGVKAYIRGEAGAVPPAENLSAGGRQLIADEYQNMKGLQRYGRSNGLCPYSPYEDLAGNSLRFVEMAQKVRPAGPSGNRNPYESFYYFYNNELVYQYNKFTELAKAGLLKAVNQPDVLAFRREQNLVLNTPQKDKNEPSGSQQSIPSEQPKTAEKTRDITGRPANGSISAPPTRPTHDTVYVERVRVDTVYMDRVGNKSEVTRSLDGFATNNMVLLLDVSASMDSPLKLPLLKRSIKSLLTLLRPEDQISIVLYSGKARVVLKPTSGAKAAEIGRMIDLLQSSGDTDGNEGIRLAYKVANKEYIRGGNNRIVLATDGEFPVSDEVLEMVGQNARQDVNLTVFTFGRNQLTGRKLRKLSELGQGTYAHVTAESADLQLIMEAQAKKKSTP